MGRSERARRRLERERQRKKTEKSPPTTALSHLDTLLEVLREGTQHSSFSNYEDYVAYRDNLQNHVWPEAKRLAALIVIAPRAERIQVDNRLTQLLEESGTVGNEVTLAAGILSRARTAAREFALQKLTKQQNNYT